MTRTFKEDYIVFCDGACSGNPGPGGWGSIIANDHSVIELGGRASQTTNNQMELLAMIKALEYISLHPGSIAVFSDSVYALRGIKQWIFGWKKRGWRTAEGKEVLNKDLWISLDQVVQKIKKSNSISWHYVRGHTGVPGNERCDQIAVLFRDGINANLFNGPRKLYTVEIDKVPDDTSIPESKPKETSSSISYYMSLIGQDLQWHTNWSDCENRVKGRPNTKFKKIKSHTEAVETLSKWGLTTEKIENFLKDKF